MLNQSDNSYVISRVYLVGYALTSYQECPKCKKNVMKGELNIINERVIKYPVVNKSIKEFYHYSCYDVKCLQRNDNKYKSIEQVEGYNKLIDSDQKKCQALINSHIVKLKSNSNDKTGCWKTKENISYNSLKEDSRQTNFNQNRFNNDNNNNNNNNNANINRQKKENNDSNKNNDFNGIKVQSSLLEFTHPKMNDQDSYNDRLYSRTQQNAEHPLKQKTISFKPNDPHDQASMQRQESNKAAEQKVKSIQSKMEYFQFDKDQHKLKKQEQTSHIAAELGPKQNKKQIESSDDDIFQPKNLILKRDQNKNNTDPIKIQNTNKIITTSEKIEILRNQKKQPTKSNGVNIKNDPKKKMRKLNNEEGKIIPSKKKLDFQQWSFDEFDSDDIERESRESTTSKINQQMIPEIQQQILTQEQDYSDQSELILPNGSSKNGLIQADDYKYNPNKNKEQNQQKQINQKNEESEDDLNYFENKFQNSKSFNEKQNKKKIIGDKQERDPLSKFEYNKFNYLKQQCNQMQDESDIICKPQSMLTQYSNNNSKVLILKKSTKLSTDLNKLSINNDYEDQQQNEQLHNNQNITFKSTIISSQKQGPIKRTQSQNKNIIESLTKEELIQLLVKNGYKNIFQLSQSFLKCIVSDGMNKGALPQCLSCDGGQLIYNEIKDEYYCDGSITQCKQIYKPSEIVRKKWIT